MRRVQVYRNQILAGTLTEEDNGSYVFRYDDHYLSDPGKPSISLTLPKTRQVYTSDSLFPFFLNMLSEGANRRLQSRLLKIDENDHFGLLAATAGSDTIGAITVKPIEP